MHGLDQRQRRAETSEEVNIRQGQNALGSLSLSTGLTPSHNRAELVFMNFWKRQTFQSINQSINTETPILQ